MSIGWVAATVRARAMARRRLGLVGIRRVRTAGSLAAARAVLADTAYAAAGAAEDLAGAQRAVADAILWQVRVLAGWMPASGTPLARAVVAAFERENLADHLRRLTDGVEPDHAPFDLGSLSTAWHRARATTEVAALQAELAASAWGEVPVTDQAAFRDATAAAWFARLAAEVPGATPVAVVGATVLVGRCLVVEGRRLGPAATAALDPLLGPRWSAATTIEELRTTLGTPARRVLDGVTAPDGLWLAEIAAWNQVADVGARLLREPLAGPPRVTGAIAVLGADGFRVRAALAEAAAGGGEVLGELG